MKKRSLDLYQQEMLTKVNSFYRDFLKIEMEKDLGISNYYCQSLTCTSFAKEYNDLSSQKIYDNRGLATLGDAVLDACLSKLAFLSDPFITRGQVTDYKRHFGRNLNLNQIGEQVLHLNSYLLKRSSDHTLKKGVATALEAIIGCLFLSKGFDNVLDFVYNNIVKSTATFILTLERKKKMKEKNVEYYVLSNGIQIPVIGFGTWQITDEKEAYFSVMTALKEGYRHIDTALAYQNEKSVGKAIHDSKIKREEIFVTTKLPAHIKGYQEALTTFSESLQNLGLDYIDLYLIHAPKPWDVKTDGMEYMELNIQTWRAFEKLYKDGKVKAIGVSNFNPNHLEVLIKNSTIVPMVNQILINPKVIPHDTIEYCLNHNILVEAYSPLATGRILDNPKLEEIAKKYNRSVAQICVRWSLQKGFLPLPKSVNLSRIKENFEVFDFEITQEDMKYMENL